MGPQVKNEIFITDDSRPYLEIQKGSLDRFRDSRAIWDGAYQGSLIGDLNDIGPYLPARCERILDIGGGMGGIDILLWRHYAKPRSAIWESDLVGPEICIVDGMEDPPVMELHRKTFSNAAVSQEFLRVNGIRGGVAYWSPAQAKRMTMMVPCDLVISLGAWCFHLPPEEYLDFVKRSCHAGTVLILDMRKDHPEWRLQISDAFERVGTILDSPKFERMVFRAR